MAWLIIIIFSVSSLFASQCDKDKQFAWHKLEELVDSGYVFSQVQWDESTCTARLDTSEYFQIDHFVFPNLTLLNPVVLEQLSKPQSSTIQSSIQNKSDHIESFGYYEVTDILLMKDSMRQVLYPVIMTRDIPSSEINFFISGGNTGVQSMLNLNLANVLNEMTDINISWIQNENLRDLYFIADKHKLLGSFWTLGLQYHFQSIDSLEQNNELGVQLVHRDEDKYQFGFISQILWGFNEFDYEVHSTGLALEYGADLWSWRRENHYFETLTQLGIGTEGGRALRYFTLQSDLQFQWGFLKGSFLLRNYHGFHFNLAQEHRSWNGFMMRQADKMRLYDQNLQLQEYNGFALEYWWELNSSLSGAPIVEHNLWKQDKWSQELGFGTTFYYQGTENWEVLLSWLYLWNSSFENSRILIGVSNKF